MTEERRDPNQRCSTRGQAQIEGNDYRHQAFRDVRDKRENSVTFAYHPGNIGRSNVAATRLTNVDTRQRTQNVTRRHRAEQIAQEHHQINFHHREASFAGC